MSAKYKEFTYNGHTYKETTVTKIIDDTIKRYKLKYKCLVVDDDAYVLYDLTDGIPIHSSNNAESMAAYIGIIRLSMESENK